MRANLVVLGGNLVRDPEIRVTPTGLSLCKLSMAVNESFKTKDGEMKEMVCYVDVDFWGAQAETIGKFFSKGRAIYIQGRLKLDRWTDADGKQKQALRVMGEKFSFCDGSGDKPQNQTRDTSQPRRSNQGPPRFSEEKKAESPPTFSQVSYSQENIDEDVPF